MRRRSRSADSSDDSIPRGKRICALQSSDDSSGSEERRKKAKKLTKLKEKKRLKLKTPEPEFPVENVIWTPSMYQKWDKTKGSSKPKKHKDDHSSPRKNPKIYQRSSSAELKKSSDSNKHKADKSKFQRSISTLESSPKYNFNSLPSGSSLPKIPKLKKL